ncbi:hypothetical protein [Acinetobacter baumannii]
MDVQKEREAFSRWVLTHPDNLDITSYEENIMFDAWQAAKAQAIPEGFVVVPKEPTQELLNKMQDFFVGAFENGLTGGQSIHCAYIAMIEAQEQAND